ncbi:MAG: 16S rRNA (cytosine(967)-C(5))-methyltransferase RsmB [Congregibacter sp.]
MKAGGAAGVPARVAAANTVADVLNGDSLERALDRHIATAGERDQALCREIAYGTLRYYPRLAALLKLLLKHPLKKKDRDVYALGLCGLYQLTYMRIPPHAAVSATVDATTALRKKSLGGLLNAVLRRYQREQATLDKKLTGDAALAQPNWLWNALGKSWPEQRIAIAEASNEKPPMTLRVNLSKTSRERYEQLLADAGIDHHRGALSPAAITLAKAIDVDSLPGFREGLCSVQDEAAQMAAYLLDAKPGESVLDACAAPGGKTGHILETAPQIGRLVAGDISADRLLRVQENLERLGFSQTTLVCRDFGERPGERLGEKPSESSHSDLGAYDAIIVDAPCSATGVIRRHPDIKVLRRHEDIAGFASQQSRLLNALWLQLKPGGRLLYVTCSVLPTENADVVASFIQRTSSAKLLELPADLGLDCGHGRQLLPQPGGHDGLFYALLGKCD